jgi:hypothetical protein
MSRVSRVSRVSRISRVSGVNSLRRLGGLVPPPSRESCHSHPTHVSNEQEVDIVEGIGRQSL